MEAVSNRAARPHRPTAVLSRWTLVVLLAVTVVPAPAEARGTYGWPLGGPPSLTRGFDPPAQRWQSGHRGVDLAGPPQSPVLSAGAGTVRFAGPIAGRSTVSVSHPDGIITTYEPVTPVVTAGQRVRRGQVLGRLATGHAGCPAAACLHWGARRGAGRSAEYLDPRSLVGALRVRLKPVGDWP